MATVNVHHAQAYLSKLLKHVAAGEEIVIARAGHPVARLIPFDPEELPKPGSAKGRLTEAFFEPLPADELDAWAAVRLRSR
jgi:prevent-host-death family protein